MSHADHYWDRLVTANPQLADDSNKMTISVAAFRKQVTKAHREGFNGGLEVGKEINKLGANPDANTFNNILKRLRKGFK